jgi:hypothetical protein
MLKKIVTIHAPNDQFPYILLVYSDKLEYKVKFTDMKPAIDYCLSLNVLTEVSPYSWENSEAHILANEVEMKRN